MRKILMRENKIRCMQEHFWTIDLDAVNKIVNIELVSPGTLTATLAEPMDACRVALQKKAAKLILAHNHPNGEPIPSEEDKDITDRMIKVGDVVHIRVLDHLIISPQDCYSFEETGLMHALRLSVKYALPAKEIIDLRAEAGRIAEESMRLGLQTGLEEGHKIGLEEGRTEGMKEKALAIAKAMKENGVAIDFIIRTT